MQPVILNILCRNSDESLCRGPSGMELGCNLSEEGSIPSLDSIANEVSMAARRLAMSQDRVRSTAFALKVGRSDRHRHRSYKAELAGSIPAPTTMKEENKMFGECSQGDDLVLQTGCDGFDSHTLHHCSTTGTIVRVMPA